MIVLKYRASSKCVKFFSLRDIYRNCCSNVGNSYANGYALIPNAKGLSPLGNDAAIEKVKTKIIYSSVLHRNHLLSWKASRLLMRKQADEVRRERQRLLKEHLFPISMKYMEEFTSKNKTSDYENSTATLPLAIEGNAELAVSYDEIVGAEAIGIAEVLPTVPATLSTNSSLEPQDKGELVPKHHLKRNISCGGCGARIQCEEQYNPGFIPLEFLSSQGKRPLSLLCQRCYFTRSLKVSLQVNFSPSNYLKELNELKSRRSLVLAVFDVTDISHSICSSVSDFVGKGHPVILVGNKIDLLPPDSHGYLNRVSNQIKEFFKTNGWLNIKEVVLVSSLSGIGIENLITKIFSIWKNYGDIYLVGQTNVGKSSIFNALLNSDLCKAMSSVGIHSATTSPWPGTTLGILKFPITRPAGKFMFFRTKRLQSEHKERKLAKMEESSDVRHKGYLASPDTFSVSNLDDINCEMGTTAVNCTIMPVGPEQARHLGISTTRLRDDYLKWCHDTPGIPHTERTLDLLTPDEMRYALPGPGMIIPRTFYMKVGLSLFIGGLARLDHNTGDHPICITVFASSKLPLLVCTTANAEEIYAALLGTSVLGVPRGGRGRLEHWPPFASKDYEVIGCGWKESCADVLLSSAGWMAITAGKGMVCSVRAHTPLGFGIDLRTPSLMPYSVLQKGPRRTENPAYPPLKEHLFTKYSS